MHWCGQIVKWGIHPACYDSRHLVSGNSGWPTLDAGRPVWELTSPAGMRAAKYIQFSILSELKGIMSQLGSERDGQLGRKWEGTTSVSTATLLRNRYATSTMVAMATIILKSLKMRRNCGCVCNEHVNSTLLSNSPEEVIF